MALALGSGKPCHAYVNHRLPGFRADCLFPLRPLSLSFMSSVAEIASGPRFLGRRRDYWRLLSRGAVLLLLTLGIYRFWLMTDVRSFLWCHTEIDGETLEYLGTPFELLLGFLIALT